MSGATLQIRLSGAGGQGLILAGRILADAFVAAGRHVAQSQGYEPTSRGGLSRADLVVTDGIADYPLVTSLDHLVILDEAAAGASLHLLRPHSLVLVDAERVTSPPSGPFRLLRLSFAATARRIGSARVANMVALGALAATARLLPSEVLRQTIAAHAPARFRALSAEGFDAGLALGAAAAPA